MSRLYVIVRTDIPPGLQVAQACHATREFTLRHPDVDVGENLVVLEVPSEQDLQAITERCFFCASTPFFEPDLGGQMTAVAVSGAAKPMLRSLPLAFSV